MAAGLLTGGAASAAWVAFLISQGLDRADKWSSVAAFLGIVIFGIPGLIVSLRERQNKDDDQGIPSDGSANSSAATNSRANFGPGAEAPPIEEKPVGGSVFHINAETAYTAHEMTVYNDGADDKNQ
jgi:hypothetical protein